jgi:hypothetical protein
MRYVAFIGWSLIWAAVGIIIVATLSLLTGCEAGPDKPPAPEWARYQLPNGIGVYVIPHTLPDGTQCVIAAGGADGSAGITCDWGRP